MSGAHGLHGLALAAIRSAPQRPVIARTNCITTIPEFRGYAAVAGMFDHAAFFAAFNFPADFSRKLKMVTAVVNGPRAIRFHVNRVVGIGYQVFVLPFAGMNADVRHANYRQAVPAFRAHGAAAAIQSDG